MLNMQQFFVRWDALTPLTNEKASDDDGSYSRAHEYWW